MSFFDTQGTTFLNNNELIAFESSGKLIRLDTTSMETEEVATLNTGGGPDGGRSDYTDIVYNPLVSPYLYAMYSGFGDDGTTNTLFVVDPRDNSPLPTKLTLVRR